MKPTFLSLCGSFFIHVRLGLSIINQPAIKGIPHWCKAPNILSLTNPWRTLTWPVVVLKLTIRGGLSDAENGDFTRNFFWWICFLLFEPSKFPRVKYDVRKKWWILHIMVSASKKINGTILPNVGINNWQEERAWSQRETSWLWRQP